MSDTANTSQTQSPRRFRFSIGTLLLWLTIVALTANTIVTNRQLAQLKIITNLQIAQLNKELSSHQPLPPKEVARQFEKSTTRGTITTSVKDVRYSPESDVYRVEFSWVDSANGKSWGSDMRLTHDGFGVYYGQTMDKAFTVAVRTPSPLGD